MKWISAIRSRRMPAPFRPELVEIFFNRYGILRSIRNRYEDETGGSDPETS